MKKFKLTSETKVFLGKTLYRIEATINFSSVQKGDKGGFIEREENLSRENDAWVYGDAQVYGNARVTPVTVSGLDYPVTVIDAHMQIGCEFHLISEWRGFDDRRIAAMDGRRSARFWKAHGAHLLALCAAVRPDA